MLKQWIRNDNIFNELYYKELIGKKILFEHIGIVQCPDKLIYDVRLLVRKVYELRNVLEIGTLLAQAIYSALLLMHHESYLFEGVDVTIY